MTGRRARAAEFLFLLSVCLWMARTVFVTFGPASARIVGGFTSDTAIPVIMANETRVTPFHLYYFGQDRWGAWPFLILSALHRTFGTVWTPERVSMIQTSVFILGAPAVLCLNAAFGCLWAAVFLVTAVLNPLSADYVFSLANPYGWYTPLLLGSWVSIRRLMRSLAAHASDAGESGSSIVAAATAMGFFGLLAQWTWTLSAPLLLIVIALESVLLAWTSGLRPWMPAIPVGLIAVAVGIELLARGAYHRYASTEFGQAYQSPIALDLAHWKVNLGAVWGNLTASGWSWWGVFSAAGLLVSLGLAVRMFVREKQERIPSPDRIGFLESIVFAAGCALIGAAVVGANVATNWPRLNSYNERYLTTAYLFWPVGAAAGLTAALSALSLRPSVRSWIKWGATVAVFIVCLAFRPRAVANPEYADMVAAARELGAKKSGAILLGQYWGTYLFAGLSDPGLIAPLPYPGMGVRMPWIVDRIERAESVVVSHYRTERYRTVTGPVDRFVEYGQRFVLSEPRWVSQGPFEFSLYTRVGPVPRRFALPRTSDRSSRSYGKGAYQAEYEWVGRPTRICAGGTTTFVIRVVNRSASRWRTLPSALFLSYHWVDGESGANIVFDGRRTALPPMIEPDEAVEIPLEVEAPEHVGEDALVVDLVQEGVTWFSGKGCSPLRIRVRVEACGRAGAQ